MLEQTIKIKSYDVHPNGLLKISALQKYMQQIAREDSDSYGATYKRMREQNMVFVLTKLSLRINRPIRDEEIITIRTVNNRLDGASFVREFLVSGSEGLVAEATTYWVLLDFEKRTVLRPSALMFRIPAMNVEGLGVPIKKRIVSKDTVLGSCGKYEVRFSDLDENDHLNNAFYSDIIADFSPVSLYENRISAMQISFASEARLGDILDISASPVDGGFILVAGNERTGSVCFESETYVTAL